MSADSRQNVAFVYGTLPQSNTGSTKTTRSIQAVHASQQYNSTGSPWHEILAYSTCQVNYAPSFLPDLSPAHGMLLDYFTHRVSRSFMLHGSTHGNFCSTYIPMAIGNFSTPTNPLLASVLSLAALHRRSVGLPQNDLELAQLRYASVTTLRTCLGGSSESQDVAIATALILCLCEIMDGGKDPNSWRLHLEGAAALLAGTSNDVVHTTRSDHSNVREASPPFLCRWWRSLEVLTLLCGKPSLSLGSRLALRLAQVDDEDYIDEFDGFSTGLIPIFAEINLLSIERQQMTDKPLTEEEICANLIDLHDRCEHAVRKVAAMLECPTRIFHPSIRASISEAECADFMFLNESYHHVALLQLNRRIHRLPLDSEEVQSSVRRICDLFSSIRLKDGACPGVAMLQPIFTAGCEAYQTYHKDMITQWMDCMEIRYGMGNVRHAKAFLKELWLARDTLAETTADIAWDEYLGMYHNSTLLDSGSSSTQLTFSSPERMGAVRVLN
jgi:hypothetical protein